jgi:hypothetical protein
MREAPWIGNSRLCGFLLFFLSLSLGACASKQSSSWKSSPKTFFRVTVSTKTAFEQTAHFLEWVKGYEIRIKDPERGLMVTDWASINPLEKYQLTVRIEKDVEGASIVSVHRQGQFFDSDQWKEAPTNPSHDAEIIKEIREHLSQNLPASR